MATQKSSQTKKAMISKIAITFKSKVSSHSLNLVNFFLLIRLNVNYVWSLIKLSQWIIDDNF